MVDEPISEHEERDSYIEFLSNHFSQTQLSRMFPVSRQRVGQILEQRGA